jgi:opacity protein-like surface antigen
VTSYEFSALEYENSVASLHDRIEHSFSQELRYLWLPTTTVSGHYRFSINDFQNTGKESITQSLIAGLNQSFSPRLKASLHSGVQFRSSGNSERTSPFLETSLTYDLASAGRTVSRQSAGTYVIWTTRYSIEESDVQTAAGRETFRTNLKLNYAMTARISASLGLTYSNGDNNVSNQISSAPGRSSAETTFDITPSLHYAITQRCSVNVGYRHTDVSRGSRAAASDPLQSFNSYTRNRYFAGITVSF